MVGQNIGKYRVIDRVGRGGMGTVFRAVDDTLNREVAIKILNAELNDPEVARRFRAEAVTVARLNHPGIATIFELFQHEGQWMMVMEFVRGETLEHLVERQGPLSPQRAADLTMQALAALAHAHRMGVVHRDLKPANVMITESGAVKIMDFGIARVAGSEHLTHAGFLMGTPAYMAPEQVTGGEIDARTDLYSMGVVFYYLVSGRLPFKGDNPIAMAQSRVNDKPIPVAQVREGLPAWIEPLIERALSKPPEERFQSADQFREALRRGLAGLPMETLSGLSLLPELIATTPPGTVAIPPLTMPPPSGGTTPLSTTPPPSQNPSARLPLSPAAAAAASKRLPMPPKAAAGRYSANPIAIGLGALALLLAVLVAVMLFKSYRQASTTATPSDPGTASVTPAPQPPPPAPTPAESPSPSASTSSTPSPAVTPALTSSPTPKPTAGGTGPVDSTLPAPTASPSPGARRGLPPASRGVAPVDTQQSYGDAKFIHVKGEKGDDEDATITFGSGLVSVTGKSGVALASEPYKEFVRATYVHAKNPKWDPLQHGPPPALDLSSVFNRARHWLVLQTRSTFVILRLDDSNWKQILETFETRTGLKVDRPAA